jgi:hypothetical protein
MTNFPMPSCGKTVAHDSGSEPARRGPSGRTEAEPAILLGDPLSRGLPCPAPGRRGPYPNRGHALAKSAMTLSPAVLKMRPRCEAISPSMMERHAFNRASVPTSSRCSRQRRRQKSRPVCALLVDWARSASPRPTIARHATAARSFRRRLLPPRRAGPERPLSGGGARSTARLRGSLLGRLEPSDAETVNSGSSAHLHH